MTCTLAGAWVFMVLYFLSGVKLLFSFDKYFRASEPWLTLSLSPLIVTNRFLPFRPLQGTAPCTFLSPPAVSCLPAAADFIIRAPRPFIIGFYGSSSSPLFTAPFCPPRPPPVLLPCRHPLTELNRRPRCLRVITHDCTFITCARADESRFWEKSRSRSGPRSLYGETLLRARDRAESCGDEGPAR